MFDKESLHGFTLEHCCKIRMLVKLLSIFIFQVSEGQEICVIEAMKMQNSMTAGKTGKVCPQVLASPCQVCDRK